MLGANPIVLPGVKTESGSHVPQPLRRISAKWWAGSLLIVGVYLAGARWHIYHGAQNTDEGFYAVATRAVAQGEMPYRDFGFTQPPLVLYANSLPLRLIGFGLFQQRVVNGVWAALALGLAAGWLAGRTRAAWGWGLGLLFATSAPWMYFIHLGKTYGLTTLLAMLAALAFLRLPAGPRRNFVLGVLAVLGVGTRLPAAPFFGTLWLLALWPGRRPTGREVLTAFFGLAMAAAVVVLPFGLAAPEAAWFWTVDFHRLSLPSNTWRLDWRELVALAPAVWLLGGMALVVVAARRRLLTREAGVIMASGVALAANLLPTGVYEEYGVPFLLPLATASAALVADELRRHRRAAAWALTGGLVAAQLLTAPALYYNLRPERRGTASAWLTPRAPDYDPALPAELAGARRVVEAALAPDAPFIGPNLILAAETGRPVPPELRMGPFACTDEMPPERAARLHLAARAQVEAWFARPNVKLLALFKLWNLDYGWSMPSFATTSDESRAADYARLQRDFDVAYRDGTFLLAVRKPEPKP